MDHAMGTRSAEGAAAPPAAGLGLRGSSAPQIFLVPLQILLVPFDHPRANTTTATKHITSTLNKIEQLSPDSQKFILGDFNHCCPDKFLKGFQQYVKCTTRMGKILDKCYGSVQDAYRALPLPPLGSADHHTILLAPAYTPVVRRATKVTKNIKQWTLESIQSLQGCFESTDWDSLLSTSNNINEQVDTVSSYISFCVDNIVPSKTDTFLPNNKPWITKELKEILNRKKRIFFTGSELEIKRSTKRSSGPLKLPSWSIRIKWSRNWLMETSTQLGRVLKPWPPLTLLPATLEPPGWRVAVLLLSLMTFYTRFESDNSTQLDVIRSELNLDNSAFTFSTQDVVRSLRRTRERSSPGPDNISGRVLRHCAQQLGDVFRILFQSSMDSSTVPQLWKHSTVIPIPKKSKTKTLNDLPYLSGDESYGEDPKTSFTFTFTFNHLADAFIQSDVQMRRTIEAIRPSREQQYTSAMTSLS